MTRIHKTAIVPYSNHDMFELVNHIDEYPDFLPWCKAVTIHSRTPTEVVATIAMGGAGLEKSFTTSNIIKPDKSIQMKLVKGPFSHLQGHWDFHALGQGGCKVSLQMEFKVSNRLLSVSLQPVFTKIANNLVGAFVQRAKELYGNT